jgi:hypothetical protein
MKYLFMLILMSFILIVSICFRTKEGFISGGNYPKVHENVILDDYPQIGKNDTSNKSYNDIWKSYPVFPVGSYEQITNNIRYNKNPDIGTCIRADFCDAIYMDKQVKSNVIKPMSPAEEGDGARVGYYRTEPNKLYYSIPNNENILY